MRRVLIVSPHFPPISAPDHQRVRMSLPYFRDFGWETSILSVDPRFVEGVCEPLLEQMMPDDIEVIRTPALPLKHTSKFGLGNLGLRSLPYLRQAGTEIIRRKKIDLVYFSTTMFPVMSLGREWYERFGVPYVLDFQDPWLSDYYRRPGAPEPPGGRLKYGVSQAIAGILEPYSLRKAKHTISVSPAYPQILLRRYSWLREEQFTVLPFGACEKEFDLLPALNIKQRIFDAKDGKIHWVYVGVVPGAMHFALRALFSAIREHRSNFPERWRLVKIHFVGTSYAPESLALKTVEPVAREYGIDDLIDECPQRVSYFEALQILVESDAIFLIGSDDPGYTASKLYPCILARKPIFGVIHDQSSVVDIMRKCNVGQIVTFDSTDSHETLSERVSIQLQSLLSLPKGYTTNINWSAFQPYTAREITRSQCAVFDDCVNPSIAIKY